MIIDLVLLPRDIGLVAPDDHLYVTICMYCGYCNYYDSLFRNLVSCWCCSSDIEPTWEDTGVSRR